MLEKIVDWRLLIAILSLIVLVFGLAMIVAGALNRNFDFFCWGTVVAGLGLLMGKILNIICGLYLEHKEDMAELKAREGRSFPEEELQGNSVK